MKMRTSSLMFLGCFALMIALPGCDSSADDHRNQNGGPYNSHNDNRLPDGGICGNSVADLVETCDGTDLRGKSCTSLGWEGGNLGCQIDCHGLDQTGCTGQPPCGNGQVDPEESCDGENLQGYTCEMVYWAGPFVGGSLSCDGHCSMVLTGCVADTNCGNGVWDGLEECDNGVQNSDTAAGASVCRTNCRLASCGDGVNDLPFLEDACDDGLDNSDTEPDACRWDCYRARCGDGVKDTPEACDGDDLGGASCTTQGFQGGTLTCDSTCLLDTSGCIL